MNLNMRIAAGGTALMMVTLFGVAAIANAGTGTNAGTRTQSAAFDAPTTLAVTGTLVDRSLAHPRAFTGQMNDLSVTTLNGTTSLTGTLTGTGLPAAGTKVTAVVNALTTDAPTAKLAAPMATPEPSPTTTAAPMCRILTLDITQLHLDLLGLVVLVPKPGLHVIVGGAPRPGALLGNLLCSIAKALDPGATISPTAIPSGAVGAPPAPAVPAPAAPAPATQAAGNVG